MKAVTIVGEKVLEIRDVDRPQARPGEVVISLRASALNHRDVWIRNGQYSGTKYPCIPGSDGAGVVISVGLGVDHAWIGREVMINPSFGWGDDPRFQGPQFSILGSPLSGTLAEEVSVPVVQVSAKPSHLSWTESAALPLAGLTAYRALMFRANLREGERVLITGIGSGVALFALQFARAVGAKVWVTSSSEEKIQRAVSLGATEGFNYSEAGWEKKALKSAGNFDVIIDSAGGPGFEQLIDLAAAGGRIVFFGATRGNPPLLPSRKIFWRQLCLLGTTMGSPQDWTNMLALVESRRIQPVVSAVFPLAEAAEAFELMDSGGQFGKIVITSNS